VDFANGAFQILIVTPGTAGEEEDDERVVEITVNDHHTVQMIKEAYGLSTGGQVCFIWVSTGLNAYFCARLW
jgi:hypothetical protein